MSTYASLTISVYDLDESTFDAFIREPFLDDESFFDMFEGHVVCDWEYLAGDNGEQFGQMLTDSDVKWRPFDVLPALGKLTEKYPEALVKIRVCWTNGDDGDDCRVSYCYVKNGKYFTPEIRIIVEEFDEAMMKPIAGGFYDDGNL